MAVRIEIFETSSSNHLGERIEQYVNEIYPNEKLIDIKYTCASARSGSTTYSAMIITERD